MTLFVLLHGPSDILTSQAFVTCWTILEFSKTKEEEQHWDTYYMYIVFTPHNSLFHQEETEAQGRCITYSNSHSKWDGEMSPFTWPVAGAVIQLPQAEALLR